MCKGIGGGQSVELAGNKYLLYHFDQVFSHRSQMTLNWTLQVFHHGSWAAMNTCLCQFLLSFGPFWCLSRPKFGSWTPSGSVHDVMHHTLWTVGRNGTVNICYPPTLQIVPHQSPCTQSLTSPISALYHVHRQYVLYNWIFRPRLWPSYPNRES